MNEENLRPIRKGELSKEEAKRRGQKGGISSVKSRRRKKAITDVAKMIGNLPRHGGEPSELFSLDDASAANANLTVDTMVLLKLAEKAMKGDVKAQELYFRIRGGEFSGKDIERAANIAKMKAETKAIQEGGLAGTTNGGVVIVDNIPDVQGGGDG